MKLAPPPCGAWNVERKAWSMEVKEEGEGRREGRRKEGEGKEKEAEGSRRKKEKEEEGEGRKEEEEGRRRRKRKRKEMEGGSANLCANPGGGCWFAGRVEPTRGGGGWLNLPANQPGVCVCVCASRGGSTY